MDPALKVNSNFGSELHRCEMELEFIDMSITSKSLQIQGLMRYQSAVYCKYNKTQQLRFKCQYNNMSRRINVKCKELRELEMQFAEKEQYINQLKLQNRLGKRRWNNVLHDLDSLSSASSTSSSGSSSSSSSVSSCSSSTSSSSSSFSSYSFSPSGAHNTDEDRIILTFDESGLDSSDEENSSSVPPNVFNFHRELELLGLDLSDDEDDEVENDLNPMQVLTFTM